MIEKTWDIEIFKEANLQARNWRFSSKNFCTLDFLTKLEMSRKGDGVSRIFRENFSVWFSSEDFLLFQTFNRVGKIDHRKMLSC